MVKAIDYCERFVKAMADSKKDTHAVAKAVGITYQAVKKVEIGTTRMLAADNNVKAARFMGVDSEWLATGEARPAQGATQHSPAALRVAAIYDQVSRKDRRHIDYAADAALSPDDLSEATTADGVQHTPAPTPTPESRD